MFLWYPLVLVIYPLSSVLSPPFHTLIVDVGLGNFQNLCQLALCSILPMGVKFGSVKEGEG